MNTIRISDSARIIGKVRLGDNAYISQGTILRSVEDSITIGNSTWVLENSVVIGSPEHPVTVGQKTVFGHKCAVLGATIGNLCEIGNATLFLPGAVVGNMCIFGEGTVVPAGMNIPDNSVVVGRPGRILRTLTPQDKAMITRMRSGDISLQKNTETIVERDGEMSKLYAFGETFPTVAKTAIVYDTAEITGDVIVGEHSVIGSGVKIIGDSHGPVRIGNHVQILENTVLHLLPDNQLILHDHVTIGPNCMIHGTIIGEHSVVEAGAIVCDNSVRGKNTRVKAGSLVKQRDIFEDHAVVEGFPAKKIEENKALQQRPVWAVRDVR